MSKPTVLSQSKTHYILWLSNKIFLSSLFQLLKFRSVWRETNTTKGQTNPLKVENPLKSAAKLKQFPSVLFTAAAVRRAVQTGGSGTYPFHLCTQRALDEHDRFRKAALPENASGKAWPPWLLLTTVHCDCLTHGTAGLVSPSPNKLLLGSLQHFSFRAVGSGSKASKYKWVDISSDLSPPLT